jgi:hypothetical protein
MNTKASVTTPSATKTTQRAVKTKASQKAEPKVETKVEVKVEEPVIEPKTEPVVEATVEATIEETNVPSFKQRLELLIQSSQSHILVLKSQIQELRRLQRDHELLIKEASKKNKKKKILKDFTKPRRSTGFAEPVIVSDELYAFLTKTKATMKDPSFVPASQDEHDNWPRIPVKNGVAVARTDVTSHISKYIKDHNLQNPQERREIIPDAALRKIFSEPVEESKTDASKKVYTYLKLQKYVNHHFPARKPTETA